MRDFSRDCLKWARKYRNASNRQMIVNVAREWMKTADDIDRCVADGRGEMLPDLRTKLN